MCASRPLPRAGLHDAVDITATHAAASRVCARVALCFPPRICSKLSACSGCNSYIVVETSGRKTLDLSRSSRKRPRAPPINYNTWEVCRCEDGSTNINDAQPSKPCLAPAPAPCTKFSLHSGSRTCRWRVRWWCLAATCRGERWLTFWELSRRRFSRRGMCVCLSVCVCVPVGVCLVAALFCETAMVL